MYFTGLLNLCALAHTVVFCMISGMDVKEYFREKKITVMGLGLLGRGVGDVAFLAECGAEVLVTDLKSKKELRESVEKLRGFINVEFVLGEHRRQDFENKDLILVAAGVPSDSEYLAHARQAGVRLVQSAALFLELSGVPMIGVTGTRGKSTVTAMIHHVLRVVTGENIIKGGNVRGVSNLQLLKEVKEDSLAVFELDSWQLQGFGWAKVSPQIAVFTNFMEDHQNYYRSLEDYFVDKANIFRYQEESGIFITTPEVFERAKKLPGVSLGQEVVLADASVLPEDCLLAMPGEHNRLNAALAYEALRATSLEEEEIFNALASFPGVEGRLQYLREQSGTKIYNDNNATTPQATVEGLKAVANGKNVVLIVGGSDKKVSLDKLPEAIEKYVDHLILYSGTGTELLKQSLPDNMSAEEHNSLEACVEAAFATATAENVILYSPAFASFGNEFKNEYDRNDKFIAAVTKFTS